MDTPQRRTWAPRVSRYKIAQLYHCDAIGRPDEALCDDVGYAFLARVQDCLTVTEAHKGRVKCPVCGDIVNRQANIFHHKERDPEELLICPCGLWQMTWGDFHKSYRNKHLGSAGLVTFFCKFAESFPRATTYQEKMILIDSLLHRYHWELEGTPGGPAAVNLIGGTRKEIIAFLNQLTYSDQATAGLSETKQQWLNTLNYCGYTAENVNKLSEDYPWQPLEGEE